MPVYDYFCEECGDHFEYWQSFHAANQPVECPKGHLKTKKVFSTPSVVFKGSGFYVNDHHPTSGSRRES